MDLPEELYPWGLYPLKSKEEIPKPKSPWFCDSPEAKEHKKNCKKDQETNFRCDPKYVYR